MADLTRYRPFAPMQGLRRELDRLFGEFFPAREEGDEEAPFSVVWAPRMDVSETNDAYVVKMDLPGVNKEDVTVNVEDGRLTVSGERKEEKKEEKQNFHRMERFYGNFFRSVSLPRFVDQSKVKAEFKGGVLTIHLPKTAESKPRRVQIT